jgi:SAM-dependent methyltransferase
MTAEAADRYDAERRQGRAIVDEDLEHVWGWSSPAGVLRADRRAQFLIDAAELGPGVRCLELGCGTGEFTTRLAESGCDLVAVDVSEDAVRRCRERVDGRAQVVIGNIETGEGLEGREFDALVGVSVLHHVDVAATLRSVVPKLRRQGRFAFSEPNLANPLVWAVMNVPFMRRRAHALEHERAFLARALRNELESGGLSVEVCEPFEFLHPATPRRFIPLVRRVEPLLEKTPARAIAASIKVAGRRR